MMRRYLVKADRDKLEEEYIMAVAMRLVDYFKGNDKVRDAVKGYVIGKMQSLKRRVSKYYGLDWFNLVYEKNAIADHIRDFLKRQMLEGVKSIVTTLQGLGEDIQVEEEEEDIEDDEFKEGTVKANYMHDGKSEYKQPDLNNEGAYPQ